MGNCWEKPAKEENPLVVSSVQSSGVPKSFNTDGKSTTTSTQTMSSAGWSVPLANTAKGEVIPSANLRVFSYTELRNATRNFRVDSVLGEGGFGCVFKGWVEENGLMASKPGAGMAVAVKKMNNESYQGHNEWLAEVNYLGQFYHPNLVKLIGYCVEDDQRLLVYEYMAKGSLENHLFRRGSNHQPLPWDVRMKVALGAARGLAFLHNAERQVIYRDFKTSNILLDSNYNPKLSDFGLAKDGPTGDNTHVSTRVIGTYGYAAPEYVATGHLTARSDVYSFGVVLLEILSGRRALDRNRPSGEQKLVDWARPLISDKRKVHRVMDVRLEGQYPIKGAYMAASIALLCLSLDSKNRPSMNTAVEVLEQVLEIKESERYRQPENLTKNNSNSSNRSNSNSNSGNYLSLDSTGSKELTSTSTSLQSSTNYSR